MANATKAREEEDFWMEDEEEAPKASSKKDKSKMKTKKRTGLSLTDPVVQTALKKLQAIRTEMGGVVFERDPQLDDLFRAIVSRENILLLGPPGTGKSMFAEQFAKHVDQANIFKWLLNRTSDPSNIVGPYSVSEMTNDRFVRVTDGYLPRAHVGFLDEIFKANEPTLNLLLPILNERIFYNDGQQEPVDLRIVIAASNEYPESDDLDAFYDRFIFRHWVHYVQDPANRLAMARANRNSKNSKVSMIPPTTITLDEIDALQEAAKNINFPPNLEQVFDKMYRALKDQGIKISDRRYNKAQEIMMANALINGRDTVTTEDFTSLTYCLWNKDVKEIELVAAELAKFVNPYESKIKELLKKAEEVKTNTLKLENRTERAGEAVSANATLQEIMAKMGDEIADAKANGVDVTALTKMADKVEDIMEEIAQECLKQSVRGKSGKQW